MNLTGWRERDTERERERDVSDEMRETVNSRVKVSNAGGAVVAEKWTRRPTSRTSPTSPPRTWQPWKTVSMNFSDIMKESRRTPTTPAGVALLHVCRGPCSESLDSISSLRRQEAGDDGARACAPHAPYLEQQDADKGQEIHGSAA